MLNKPNNNLKRRIRSLMIAACVTAVDVAGECGVHPSFVGHVISGRVKTERIRRAIANRLGVQVEDLWPPDIDNSRPV